MKIFKVKYLIKIYTINLTIHKRRNLFKFLLHKLCLSEEVCK